MLNNINIYNDIILNQVDLTYLNWGLNKFFPGTAGTFLKCIDTENGIRYYYKLSNFDIYNNITIGHESINELIVSRILNLLDIDHVHYQLINAKININNKNINTYLCKSADFKKSGATSVAFGTFYEIKKYFNPELQPVDIFTQNNWLINLYNLLICDFITCQRDRHSSNYEIIQDANGKYKCAPIFDNGLSLILETDDNKIAKTDVLEDKKVQSFIGTSSVYNNLKLINKSYLQQWNKFINENDKKYIFKDLDNIISPILLEITWEMIYLRSELLKEYINKL